MQAILAGFTVETSSLPKHLQGRRKTIPLDELLNQLNRVKPKKHHNPRAITIKFNPQGEITSCTPERLALLNKYAANARTENDIDYLVDDDRLYRHQLKFIEMAESCGMDTD